MSTPPMPQLGMSPLPLLIYILASLVNKPKLLHILSHAVTPCMGIMLVWRQALCNMLLNVFCCKIVTSIGVYFTSRFFVLVNDACS